MNSPDGFEERLARTPFRPAPSTLRAQVLGAVGQTAACATLRNENSLRLWIAQWLWPHPAAWATLGLAWVAVLALHVAALDGSAQVPLRRAPAQVSPACAAVLREQHALLHRLLQDSSDPAPPEPGPDARFWHSVHLVEVMVV
jgi:hypothetical protein